jgi:lysophospholipase L1-like esterase
MSLLSLSSLAALGGRRPLSSTPSWSLNRLVSVAALGDSLTEWGSSHTVRTASPTFDRFPCRGYLGRVANRLGFNYRQPVSYAVSGTDMQQHRDFLTTANVVTNPGSGWWATLDAGSWTPRPMNAISEPDLLFTFGGRNDVGTGANAGTTLSVMQSRYTNLFNDLRTLFPNSRIQAFSLWPGNDFDATRRQKRNDFNSWLWNTFWPGKTLLTQHNHSALVQDGGNPDGLNPVFTTDGIHLSVEAARLMGDAVFAALPKPAPIVHPLGLASDSTNLLPAARLFTGTGGQGFNLEVGSVVPTGLQINGNASRGAQTTLSALEADPDLAGANKLVLTFGGTAPATVGASNVTVTFSPGVTSGLEPGKSYRFGFRLEGLGCQNLVQAQVSVQLNTTGGPSGFPAAWSVITGNYYSSAVDAGDVLPAAFDDLMITPEVTTPSTGTFTVSITFNLTFRPNQSAAGVVKISRPYLREMVYLAGW